MPRRWGYAVSWSVVNAANYGVPQLRERCFVVGLLGSEPFGFPAPTHAKEPNEAGLAPWVTAGDVLSDIDTEEAAEKWGHTAGGRFKHLLEELPPGQNYLYFTAERGYPNPQFKWRSRYWTYLLKLSPELPSWTIQAKRTNNMGPLHWRNRVLRIEEVKRLQSFPDDFVLHGDVNMRWRQLGNAVPPVLAAGHRSFDRHATPECSHVGDESGLGSQSDKALILPIANDFSPGTPAENPISLQSVLRLVKGASGRKAQAEEIRAHYFANAAAQQPDAKGRLAQQLQLSRNVLIGMDSYAVYDEETQELTSVGEELLAAASEADADRQFAKHILLTLPGIEILCIIKAMTSSGRPVNKTTLAEELNRHGFVAKAGKPLSTNTANHLKLLSWLRRVGVLPEAGYEVDDAIVRSIAGTSIDDANRAIELTNRQKVFAATLRRDVDLHGNRDAFVRDIVATCKATHPHIFSRTDDLRKAVINPLVEHRWITHSETAGGRSLGRGRGGSSGTVRATEQLGTVDPTYLGLDSLAGVPGEVRRHLNKALDQVMAELKSDDTGVKGLALETLAVRIVYELGLRPVAFRERGAENSGAEVDLIAEGSDTHFHRWMVQCKNMAKVHVEALAKEIGMAVIYRAQVILLVTTGEFTTTVRHHARELAETTGMQAILIEKAELAIYLTEGVAGLFRQFERRAREILEWKAPQRGSAG